MTAPPQSLMKIGVNIARKSQGRDSTRSRDARGGGGAGGPNYDAASVAKAVDQSRNAGLSEHVMIDCSHANSHKDHVRQANVATELTARIAAGERGIAGLMLESFLVAGAQSLSDELVYGQSVTDQCMDFPTTADPLASLYTAKG